MKPRPSLSGLGLGFWDNPRRVAQRDDGPLDSLSHSETGTFPAASESSASKKSRDGMPTCRETVRWMPDSQPGDVDATASTKVSS